MIKKIIARIKIKFSAKSFGFFSSAKLLVTTGLPFENGRHSEVIDIFNEDTICDDLQNSPYNNKGAVGGLIHENIPLVCGGWNGNNVKYNQCYDLVQNTLITMNKIRFYSSSIVVNNKVSKSEKKVCEYSILLILKKFQKFWKGFFKCFQFS